MILKYAENLRYIQLIQAINILYDSLYTYVYPLHCKKVRIYMYYNITTTHAFIHTCIYTYLRSTGSIPYAIPVGGSNAVGSWGYIEAFQELMDDGVWEKFDDIVVPAGSGGTVCGLAVANYLTGMKIK